MCGVIEFSIEKAPLIKLKNKGGNAIKETLAWDKELPSKFVIKDILINVGLGSSAGALRGTSWSRLLLLQAWLSLTFFYNLLFFSFLFFVFFYASSFPEFTFPNTRACAMFLFMCVYSYQVVYCVNRRIKISEEMALPALTPPPPRLYLSSCPPSDFSPSDPHLLLRSKRKQTSTPRAHCKPV